MAAVNEKQKKQKDYGIKGCGTGKCISAQLDLTDYTSAH